MARQAVADHRDHRGSPPQFNAQLLDAIKETLGGDCEEAVLARCENKHVYYAKVLHKAWKGMGTDEQATSRVFARNTRSDLRKIGNEYTKISGNDFQEAIRSEVGGNYRTALLVYLFNEAPGTSAEEAGDVHETRDAEAA